MTRDYENGWNAACCRIVETLRSMANDARDRDTKNGKRVAAQFQATIRLAQLTRTDLPPDRRARLTKIVTDRHAPASGKGDGRG